MELETINKLYLELSQFTTATTGQEIALQTQLTAALAENVWLKLDIEKLKVEKTTALSEAQELRAENERLTTAYGQVSDKYLALLQQIESAEPDGFLLDNGYWFPIRESVNIHKDYKKTPYFLHPTSQSVNAELLAALKHIPHCTSWKDCIDTAKAAIAHAEGQIQGRASFPVRGGGGICGKHGPYTWQDHDPGGCPRCISEAKDSL